MKALFLWIAVVSSLFACNGPSSKDTKIMDSAGLDSSAIMNDSTKLPEDSASTGVTH